MLVKAAKARNFVFRNTCDISETTHNLLMLNNISSKTNTNMVPWITWWPCSNPSRTITCLFPVSYSLFNSSIKKEDSFLNNILANEICYFNWSLTLPTHHMTKPADQYPLRWTLSQFLHHQITDRQRIGVCTISTWFFNTHILINFYCIFCKNLSTFFTL